MNGVRLKIYSRQSTYYVPGSEKGSTAPMQVEERLSWQWETEALVKVKVKAKAYYKFSLYFEGTGI